VIFANTKISVMTMKRNQEKFNYFVDLKRNTIVTTYGPYDTKENALDTFLQISKEFRKVSAMTLSLYELKESQKKKILLKQNLTYFGVN
jgi:hypothetical protein